MSYHGFWPSYRKNATRGTGELLQKAMHMSYKIDRIGVPLLILPAIFLHYISGRNWIADKELPNPYVEAVLKKKADGKYDGDNVGIRPHHYA